MPEELTAHDLERLAEEANTAFDRAETIARKIQPDIDQATTEALLCGQALLKAKEALEAQGYGRWSDWLKTYCPKISRMKAWRMMREVTCNTRYKLESTSSGGSGPVLTVQAFSRRAEWIVNASEGDAITIIQGLSPEEKKLLAEKVEQTEQALAVVKAALQPSVEV